MQIKVNKPPSFLGFHQKHLPSMKIINSPTLSNGGISKLYDGNPTILIFEQIEEYLASLQLIEKQRLFTFINTMKVNKPVKELVTF